LETPERWLDPMTKILDRSADAPERVCTHTPTCPAATAPDHDAAHIVAAHPEQGWNLLCNGVILFEDTGEILPDRTPVAPHRPGTRCGCNKDAMCAVRAAEVRALLTVPLPGGAL
jgi:hypothetical protein